MGKNRRTSGAKRKKATAARKRKLAAQREATAAKKNAQTTAGKNISHGKKMRMAVLFSVAAIVLMLAGAAFSAVFALTPAQTVEVGGRVDLSRLDGGIASVICTEHQSADEIDTSKISDERLECIFFGFIRKNIKIQVRDTIPPVLRAVDVVAGVGDEVRAGDFILSCEDKTAVNIEIAGGMPSALTEGEYKFDILATDEGGNKSSAAVSLTVRGERNVTHIEYGTDAEEAARTCSEKFGIRVDAGSIDVSRCGAQRVKTEDGGTVYILSLDVSDTTPPTATVSSCDTALGNQLDLNEIVSDIEDESEVTVSLAEPLEPAEAGDCAAEVVLRDEWGNETRYEISVRVHDIRTELTIEAGTSPDEIRQMILGGDETLSIDDGAFADISTLGEHKIDAVGEYSTVPVMITVEDTTPPRLVLRESVGFIGQDITPDKLVSECTDATKVTLSFGESVQTDKPGKFTVTVTAEDEAGNRTEEKTSLLITIDTEPPVIYGTSTFYSNVGEGGNISFSEGVYAVDNADGVVNVITDASSVDLTAAGTYYVRYSATDKAGNRAEVSAAVIVDPITREIVDALADNVLSYIISDDMTEHDKAWAIYSWCKSNITYTARTGNLIGRFIDGAYHGFRSRSGNCYVYYSVAAAMLTRAGIENMEIRRASETNPHYWNLVNIGGDWYHFDTCPHYSQYPLESFLLTDAEVSEYSERCVGYYDFDSSLYPPTP